MSKLLPAISERCEPSLKNPSGEPTFGRLETLESLDGFESAVELFVAAFDDVCSLGTATVEELLRFHVAREEIAIVEDVVQCGNFQRIIVVAWCSPTNVPLQVCLAEIRKFEDLFFEIFHKFSVGFLTSHFQGFADVLEEMDVAELDDDSRVHLSCCHADGFIVITDDGKQFVACVLELHEELLHRQKVLGWSEHAYRDVVRQVINPEDEGNLPVVALHGHVLPIDDKEAAESLGIAVRERDVVVMRQSIQFRRQCSVGGINAFADSCRECAGTCAFEMQREQWFCLASVIDAETLPAIVAEVPLQATTRAFPLRCETAAVRTSKMAARSLFLGVDMFKVGKMASPCYRIIFSGTRNRTLSIVSCCSFEWWNEYFLI